MDACESCPNRHHADTLDALAGAAKSSVLFRVFAPVLRSRAEEVRKAGCGNWKLLEENIEDRDTGQILDTRKVARCMRDRMVAYLNSVHAEAHRNGKAAESHRNVVAEGFSYLAGRPITGDCEGLPVEFREALLEAGIGKPLALPPGPQ